jgi:hypothetical protein
MTIAEWFDSEPMRQARLSMLGNTPNSFCGSCYREQERGGTSRRIKSNQKSIIFNRTAFGESYLQSPGYQKFESSRVNQGAYDGLPIDLHIDLGNYCNLACKMSSFRASSTIAVQEVKWGNLSAKKHIGTDWTRDEAVWSRVLEELASITNLNNVHFMGGETLITSRFEDFVDYMIAHDRTDLNFSFVTNGTTFNERLLEKLKLFGRVGIEVSIETVTQHNSYVRQGTDTNLVLQNMDRYLAHCDNNNITLTIRPAVSALTIGHYHSLLRYCLERNLVVKGLWVDRPDFLDAQILPLSVKQQYIKSYEKLLQEYDLESLDYQSDFNESDPHQSRRIIANQISQCVHMLNTPTLDDHDHLLKQMVDWCQKWDQVYGYNARDLYPEFSNILDLYGYSVSS